MKYPWMPLFWGDFLANTMHLSAQEAGAYLFLIAHAWEHDGMVPCCKAQAIARVNNYHWARVKAAIEPFFEIRHVRRGDTSDVLHPMYYHGRVHQELTSAAELSNKRKDAALHMHGTRRASASILHMHPPSPSPIENLSLSEEGKAQAVQMQPAATFYADFGSPELDAWNSYERAIGKTTPRDKRGGWTFPSQWPPQLNGPKQ